MRVYLGLVGEEGGISACTNSECLGNLHSLRLTYPMVSFKKDRSLLVKIMLINIIRKQDVMIVIFRASSG